MSDINNDTQLTTPVGIAKYPYLVKPDTKFDERGIYKVDLILKPSEAKTIESAAKKLASKLKMDDVKTNPARKKWGLHLPLLEDAKQDGEATGMVVVRFKQAAVLRTRDGREINKSVLIFDSQGNRVTDINPYSGTKMAVAYTMSAYANPTGSTYGVTFRLVAVQVIELVEGGNGADAESLGFSKQDGFVQQDAVNEDESFTDSSEAVPMEGKEEETTSVDSLPF